MLSTVWKLVKLELLLEFRQRYAIAGMLLYSVSTVIVCFLSFKSIVSVPVWNALLWIIILFAAFIAVGKSFARESGGSELYLYTLASAESVVLSKLIYNSMLMAVLGLATFLIYCLFLGVGLLESASLGQLALALVFGSIGLAGCLTLVAGISAKTNGNLGIISILGFPIVLPLLITLLRFSKLAIDGVSWSQSGKYALALVGITGLTWALSYLLFPYLWRE